MGRPRIRVRHAIGEAVRDLSARWVLSTVVAVCALAAGASTLLLGAHEADRARGLWDEQVAAGRFVYAVAGPRGAGVDAGTCAAVGSWSGVVSSGGRVSSDAVRPRSAPGAQYDLHHVTPGYLQVLWPQTADPPAGHVVVGPYAATNLGVSAGRTVAWTTSGGERLSAGVASVPSEGVHRVPGADRHLFAVVGAVGTVDRCLIDIEPDRRDAVLAGLRTWFAEDASAPEPISDFSRAADPEAQLAARASGWWWALASGTVTAVATAAWSARRADLALYRLLGADVGTVALLVSVDTVLLVVSPALVGIAAAAAGAAPALTHDIVGVVAMADCARFVAVLGAAPVVAIALVRHGAVFRVLKES